MAPRKKKDDSQSSPPATGRARTKKAASPPKAGRTTRKKTAPAENGSAPESPPSAGGKRNLVIVESPAKAKTIQKYLGPNFTVKASFGHIRDLIKKVKRGEIGIDIGAGWVPSYMNLDDDTHRRVLGELKKAAATSGTVYLASDPDREGEAIAWHLKEALNLADERVRRVTFNEITPNAIRGAFANAGDINMDRVKSQEARRFLDRAVGYKLSPLLRKKLKAESAGRVQSVAVRLIVDREREIQAFKPEEYWKIVAQLAPAGEGAAPQVQFKVKKKAEGDTTEGEEDAVSFQPKEGAFLAELAEWAGQKFAAKTEQDALAILNALPPAAWTVAKVEQKDTLERAKPPFTTSTLQQQANIRLGFSTQRTMTAAQKLYEGLDLGSEGQTALITYMRTDSTRLADDAVRACRDHILGSYGEPYLPLQPLKYASGKNAQEAHEAIRPTDVTMTPDRLDRLLPAGMERRQDLVRLYDLIWRQFVACQMTAAVFAVTNVDVHATTGARDSGLGTSEKSPSLVPSPQPLAPAVFKAKGKILRFDGYRKVLAPRGKQEDALLPPLAEKQKLDLLDLLGSQHFTQPPPRYNEASLVKTLEKEGIGRPSTYASIIRKIQERHYVEQKERRFYATPLGMLVTDKLIQHFPDVMNYKFTSQLEEKLDQIEEQHLDMRQVLDNFWGPFSQALDAAQDNMEGANIETGEKCPQCGRPLVVKYSRKLKGRQFVGCSGYGAKENPCSYIQPREGEEARPAPELTEHKCPSCGRNMVKRTGPTGPFLGCSGYGDKKNPCSTTMKLDAEGNPVPTAKPTEHTCEKCGKPMVLREGRLGPFLSCSGYPKCKNAKNVDAQGNPIPEVDLGIPCEKCGAAMKIRKGPRGPFLGCSAFPKCRGTKQLTAELKEQLKDVLPAAPPKQAVPEIEITQKCPECGAELKLRRGPRGFFLSCSKYPKCKGKGTITPEIMEQLQQHEAAGAST